MTGQPPRIVSLVPSLTETVAALGLEAAVVGCTHFCVRPKGLQKRVRRVGGTKDPDLAVIADLAPTHVLTNEEENKPEHIAQCEQIAQTIRTFPKAPSDAPQLLRELGRELAVTPRAEELATEIETLIAAARHTGGRPWSFPVGPRYLYLIWREPYMLAGSDTYISRLLELIGFVNACPAGERYPAVTIEEMVAAAPDVIFMSTEPYPFRRRDADRFRGEWPRAAPSIWKLDGQLMSWHGVSTGDALRQLLAWRGGSSQTIATKLLDQSEALSD